MPESQQSPASSGSATPRLPVWPAPFAEQPVSGVVSMPGSKSMTNRALILASISEAPSRITGALIARDTELMIAALRQLGAEIATSHSTIDVKPLVRGADVGDIRIDCGLAGTVMRFVPAMAGSIRGRLVFDGDDAARGRPMRELTAALARVGLQIDSPTGGLPLTITATGRVAGGAVDLDASASSQFISALLLAAAAYDSGISVTNTGGKVPSAPHIQMTVAMLAEHGVEVAADSTLQGRERWTVQPATINARDRAIEPDLSNALPFIAAAAVTAGRVTIEHWPANSTQPGDRMRPLLRDMGCDVRWEPSGDVDGALHVAGPATLEPIDVDMADLGELAPTLTAICLFADGESRLRNLAHIRGHETDRLSALETIGAKVGASIRCEGDDLVIGGLSSAAINDAATVTLPSFEDHRLATAGAIIGLRRRNVLVENIATTSKTLPDFPTIWSKLVG